MVHNGIEYGLMQAYAEGFEIMHASDYELDLGGHLRAVDAGLGRPLVAARARRARVPGRTARTSSTSRAGSPTPARAAGPSRRPSTSDVPAPVITLSLLTRFRSRQDDSYGAKVLAALRNEFGGHAVKTE